MLILAAAAALAQPACTPETATAATVAEIAAAPDRWLDRCVTVSGIAGGIRLFHDRESLYRSSRLAADGNRSPQDQMGLIGMDQQELRGHPALRARATRVTVTGTVDSCARRVQRVRDAGGIPFLGGYCHYFSGPTVRVAHYTIGEEQFERLTGEEARARVGDLIEATADWEWRDELEDVARRFAAAVSAGDRVALARILSYGEGMENERIAHILNPSNASYRFLRQSTPPRMRIFTLSIGGTFRPAEDGHISAYLCYARRASGDVLWPIASWDADAGPDRPYLCLNVSGRIAPPADLDVYAPESGGWLAEPAIPARRTR